MVTASRDLSLRVLTWNYDSQKGLSLESQYTLLGGSHTMSRYSGNTTFSIRISIAFTDYTLYSVLGLILSPCS